MKMKKNILWPDRALRFVAGIFLTTWAIAGGPGWTYVGLYLLATGSWGYCALYAVAGYQPFSDEG